MFFYSFLILNHIFLSKKIQKNFHFFKSISEKPAPVKGEKVSLKIHRADLSRRGICPTGRLFLLYVCNTFSSSP